jgi:hypothetical protein
MFQIRRIRHAMKDPADPRPHPRDNIYRFQIIPGTRVIGDIFAFNKNPALREAEGRWTECRSLDVFGKLQRELREGAPAPMKSPASPAKSPAINSRGKTLAPEVPHNSP